MRRDDSSPEAYRASVHGEQRALLETLRALILDQFPDASEGIKYGILDYPGVCSLAAQKHYVSVYVPPKALATHRASFPDVSCGKSCVRFRRISQLDDGAFRKLITAAHT